MTGRHNPKPHPAGPALPLISNRHTLKLKLPVNCSKQTRATKSNRHKLRGRHTQSVSIAPRSRMEGQSRIKSRSLAGNRSGMTALSEIAKTKSARPHRAGAGTTGPSAEVGCLLKQAAEDGGRKPVRHYGWLKAGRFLKQVALPTLPAKNAGRAGHPKNQNRTDRNSVKEFPRVAVKKRLPGNRSPGA
jgi:hypothetical protein